jgi:hypothetical protein
MGDGRRDGGICRPEPGDGTRAEINYFNPAVLCAPLIGIIAGYRACGTQSGNLNTLPNYALRC